MAVVIAGGVLVGTLLTLVVVRCLYAICFDERSTWLRVRQRKVEAAAG